MHFMVLGLTSTPTQFVPIILFFLWPTNINNPNKKYYDRNYERIIGVGVADEMRRSELTSVSADESSVEKLLQRHVGPIRHGLVERQKHNLLIKFKNAFACFNNQCCNILLQWGQNLLLNILRGGALNLI